MVQLIRLNTHTLMYFFQLGPKHMTAKHIELLDPRLI